MAHGVGKGPDPFLRIGPWPVQQGFVEFLPVHLELGLFLRTRDAFQTQLLRRWHLIPVVFATHLLPGE